MKKYTKEELEIIDRDFANVVGLFNLLLKIDKRNNPELYTNKNNAPREA